MDFEKTVILALKSSISSEQFWTAIEVYVKNPHSVSRRLCGSVSIFSGILLASHAHCQQDLLSKVRLANINDEPFENIYELLRSVGIQLDIETCGKEDLTTCERSSIIIKRLLPRNSDKYRPCLELIILDRERGVATFAKINPEDNEEKEFVATQFPFSLQLVGKEMQLLVHGTKLRDKSTLWLETHLFPKLVKWALSDLVPNNEAVSSLSLISIDSYNTLYQQLKIKYGKRLVEMWPEVTDPAKYVYEDIAIATYLILIWEKERKEKLWPTDKKQTFVDLGCGNGLLVFILSSEGHSGVGLDVRKRGIWDYYPKTTKLEIRSINPTEDCRFPECDWLIGNHSDELTPWIPVWASRNSYDCSFFLLPCCFFDFAGNKYQRQNTSLSQYAEYLMYVHQICTVCGFHTEIDRLKIPSTKRTCFVGYERTYPSEKHNEIEFAIDSFIQSKCANQLTFQPRPSIEKVRNCTQLKKGVIEEVIKIVVEVLLNETVKEGAMWNPGGKKTIKEMADIIPKEILQELKSECGGLQTLLRNHRFIFEVLHGYVKLREPSPCSAIKVNERPPRKRRAGYKSETLTHKRKLCWFNINHPDGCPLSAGDCPNVHP